MLLSRKVRETRLLISPQIGPNGVVKIARDVTRALRVLRGEYLSTLRIAVSASLDSSIVWCFDTVVKFSLGDDHIFCNHGFIKSNAL